MSATPDLLEAIVAATRFRVDAAMTREPRAPVERRAMARTPDAAGFTARLSRRGSINVIAECKRRSRRCSYAAVRCAALSVRSVAR